MVRACDSAKLGFVPIPRKCLCGDCKYCRARDKNLRAVRKYSASHAEKEKERKRRWHTTTGRYRQRLKKGIIDAHLVDEVLAAQGGKCAICGALAPAGNGSWHADHDHETGLLRGVLCNACNPGLGCFKDSTKHLFSAIKYLLFPPANRVREQKK